jgi:hypothetical protein
MVAVARGAERVTLEPVGPRANHLDGPRVRRGARRRHVLHLNRDAGPRLDRGAQQPVYLVTHAAEPRQADRPGRERRRPESRRELAEVRRVHHAAGAEQSPGLRLHVCLGLYLAVRPLILPQNHVCPRKHLGNLMVCAGARFRTRHPAVPRKGSKRERVAGPSRCDSRSALSTTAATQGGEGRGALLPRVEPGSAPFALSAQCSHRGETWGARCHAPALKRRCKHRGKEQRASKQYRRHSDRQSRAEDPPGPHAARRPPPCPRLRKIFPARVSPGNPGGAFVPARPYILVKSYQMRPEPTRAR